MAGSILCILVVTWQVAGRWRGAPRGVPGAPGKSLVVFWEGQGLAGTVARKGLVRGQAEEKGGQVRQPDQQGSARLLETWLRTCTRQVSEPGKNPKGQSKQTAQTFVSWQTSRTPKLLFSVSLGVSTLYQAAPAHRSKCSVMNPAFSPTRPPSALPMGVPISRRNLTILQLTRLSLCPVSQHQVLQVLNGSGYTD